MRPLLVGVPFAVIWFSFGALLRIWSNICSKAHAILFGCERLSTDGFLGDRRGDTGNSLRSAESRNLFGKYTTSVLLISLLLGGCAKSGGFVASVESGVYRFVFLR